MTAETITVSANPVQFAHNVQQTVGFRKNLDVVLAVQIVKIAFVSQMVHALAAIMVNMDQIVNIHAQLIVKMESVKETGHVICVQMVTLALNVIDNAHLKLVGVGNVFKTLTTLLFVMIVPLDTT